jgi:S-(hydroxymethyl)glutathione dehydrogenase/alcohol dehydrogenase
MKAAVLFEIRKPLRIAELEIDTPGSQEVRIRTGAAGLCHSDFTIMHGGLSRPLPYVPGHESAGIVEAVGSEVTYVKPGDHVITHVNAFCGHCDACLSGLSHMCHTLPAGQEYLTRPAGAHPRLTLDGQAVACSSLIGSFAEATLVHENAVVKIGNDIPFDVAAVLGCAVTTGVGAVMNTARVKPGSSVAVVGCGGVGLAAVHGAWLSGAARIIAVDPVPERLERAEALGATDLVDASAVDVVAAVRALTSGGVEYSFDTAGAEGTTEQAFAMLATPGTCTAVGLNPNRTIKVPGELLLFERRLQGCVMGSSNFRLDIPRWLELYRQGRLRLGDFVTSRISLDDVNSGFEAMSRGEGARTVITFDA